jgi:D,D-heptose 1,7-bisphosphate phosphatase
LQKAILLDRDGVINEMVYYQDHGFVDSPFKSSQVKIINGVPQAISLLHSLGFIVVIVSNQPGIAKGNFSEKMFVQITSRMHHLLKKEDAVVDDEFYCLHHPNGKIKKYTLVCNCRKPKTGLIRQAKSKHDIDLKKSFFIGDGIVDMLAAKKIGCKSIFVGNLNSTLLTLFKEKKAYPDHVAKNLLDAAMIIKKIQNTHNSRRYTN